MNDERAVTFLRPWIYVPLLFLLDVRFWFTEGLALDPTVLQIPIAIWFANRYGWRGFWAALIACAPLLVQFDLGPYRVGGRPAVFVVAMHAAWLTLSARWLSSEEGRVPAALRMSFLLAACSVAFVMELPVSDVGATLRWYGTPIVYYAFFVLGLRGAHVRSWLILAGAMTLAGAALRLAVEYDWLAEGVTPRVEFGPYGALYWVLDRPSEFLTLVAFFCIGRWLGIVSLAPEARGDVMPRRAAVAAGAALIVLGGPLWPVLIEVLRSAEPWDGIVPAMRLLSPVGSYYLLPGLALFLGAAWARGVWLAVAVAAALYILHAVGVSVTDVRRGFIDLELLPISIVFAVLGARVARRLAEGEATGVPSVPAARASWLLALHSARQPVTDLGDWRREHDEISSTVRRVMMSLIAYALFCAFTLAAPDVHLLGVSSEIKLPIANISVDYFAFLTIGPLVLIGLVVYLHVFLQSAIDLGRPEGARPLPYLFNMENRLAVLLAGFLLYWLPVLLLFVFAWKALPQPQARLWLGLAAAGMGVAMTYLRLARLPPDSPPWWTRRLRVVLVAFGLLFAVQLLTGGVLQTRTLRLYKADLSKRDLSGQYLQGAKMEQADLKGANLRKARMRDANLTGAVLDGASNLSDAQLRSAKLLDARMITANLSGADLRDADLSGARLDGANLARANLRRAKLSGATIVGTDLAEACLMEVDGLHDCDDLKKATNWSRAFRPQALRCEGDLPPVPRRPEAKRRNKDEDDKRGGFSPGPGEEENPSEVEAGDAPDVPWTYGDCVD